MELMRAGYPGFEASPILDGNGVIGDFSESVGEVAGDVLLDAGLDRIRALDLKSLPAVPKGKRAGTCVGQVGKVICIRPDISDHAAESGVDVRTEPILFLKSPAPICGPNEVPIPRKSQKADRAVELGVVNGATARCVDEADALDHMAGYFVVSDVSERKYQLERGAQWTKGKSADTFAPLGPWLVTRDEIADPGDLSTWLDVDGLHYQHGSTRTMVFGGAHLVHYVSQFMTLVPGDVISTGTPPRVGPAQKPAVCLRAGQVMQLGIEGLGTQRRTVGQV